MAANGNGTGDNTAAAATSCISSDIIHRLQDLTMSTSNATTQLLGAMYSSQTPAPAPPLPPPPTANNAVTVATTRTPSPAWPPPAANSSRSKGGCDSSKIIGYKLERLRRRRLFERRRPPPSVASVTDELQNLLVVGAAAFRSTPEELVGRFLRPKLSGGGVPLPRAARFIHDADVYAAEPDHLAATHAPAPAASAAKLAWFFFSPLRFQPPDRPQIGRIRRPCRRVGGGGIWRPTTGRWKLAEEGEAANWYETNLLYYEHDRRTEWRMREYGIAKGDGGWQQPLVLCELFRAS